MKQAKSIALIGLAASLILFAHYAGADEGKSVVARAGNQGLVTLGQTRNYGEVRIGSPGSRRVVPGQIPRVEPHLEVAGGTTASGGGIVDECRQESQTGNLITRFLIGQLPGVRCN